MQVEIALARWQVKMDTPLPQVRDAGSEASLGPL